MTSLDAIAAIFKTAGPNDRAQIRRVTLSDDPFWGAFPASYGRAMDPRTTRALFTPYERGLDADFMALREDILAVGLTYPTLRAVLFKNGAEVSLMSEKTLAALDAAGRAYLRDIGIKRPRFHS